MQEGFYTMKGYTLLEHGQLTTSMEDYLEMIYRMESEGGYVRITALAHALHVKPPSASKMAANLRGQGFIDFPKYGYITLTEWGRRMGAYLVHRHQVVGRLLCAINQTESELEEVEKIEHFLSPRTVANIEKFLEGLENPYK